MTSEKRHKQFIRKCAETQLSLQDIKCSQNLEKFTLEETKKMIHELEVHQIELEMQNEELIAIQEELRKTKKRYFDLYDMAPIGYCTLNKDGFIEESNLAISDLLGKDRSKLNKHPFSKFILPEDQDIFYLYRRKFLISDEQQGCELRMVKEDKTSIWVYLTAILDKNTDKENILRLVINDINERKISEEKLKLFSSVFMNAGEAIMITDLNGYISDINDTFTKITGYSKDEVIGEKPKILSSGQQTKEYYRKMWETLKKDGSWTGELWNKRKNGQIYAQILIINTVYDYNEKPTHFVALFSDITAIKEYENSLKSIAHFDQLTKLPNRVLLADRIENSMIQTRRNKQHLAVIFLDLDGFKKVNDSYGHDIGDKLLVILAKEMKKALREVDTLARIGGDEFVAVLADLLEISDALPIIVRLLESTSKEVIIGKAKINVSASLGITFYPQDQIVDADLLLRQADQAMYQAKLSGKNCYHFFNTQENNQIRERFQAIEEVREALKNNEFLLYYQPKINMRLGEVIGVEALIHWKHPKKGILLPLDFLPIVEGHILSIDIGEWVINTALSQIKTWQEEGISTPISINISANHLLEDGFVDNLKSVLSKYPTVNPNMLQLEVLETSRLEDLSKAKSVMNACIKLGLTFSLDDFGTGYSSLIYLKQLPIKQIKIDQIFVKDMLNNPNDLSILEGVISLSEAFHLDVIAEGVETSEQAIVLLGLGCDFGQGYSLAYLMIAEDFSTWLREYRPNPLLQNQELLNSNQRQLLFIKVEHKAWIKNIKAILNKKDVVHTYDMNECTFNNWIETEGKEYLGDDYKRIDLKHENIHSFADNLLALHNNGENIKALDGVNELETLWDDLNKDLSIEN